jgi:hypothetical protein
MPCAFFRLCFFFRIVIVRDALACTPSPTFEHDAFFRHVCLNRITDPAMADLSSCQDLTSPICLLRPPWFQGRGLVSTWYNQSRGPVMWCSSQKAPCMVPGPGNRLIVNDALSCIGTRAGTHAGFTVECPTMPRSPWCQLCHIARVKLWFLNVCDALLQVRPAHGRLWPFLLCWPPSARSRRHRFY